MFKISIQQDGYTLQWSYRPETKEDDDEPSCLEVLEAFAMLLKMYYGEKATVNAFQEIEVD